MSKAAERAAANGMKVWEKRVKYYQKNGSRFWQKQLKIISGRNAKRKIKEEKKSATQDDSGVERLQREKERIEQKER